jgi:hypothetical protein
VASFVAGKALSSEAGNAVLLGGGLYLANRLIGAYATVPIVIPN